jgi:hypothetical protein
MDARNEKVDTKEKRKQKRRRDAWRTRVFSYCTTQGWSTKDALLSSRRRRRAAPYRVTLEWNATRWYAPQKSPIQFSLMKRIKEEEMPSAE